MADADVRLLAPGPIALIATAITERLKLIFPEARFQHRFVPAKLDAKTWRMLTTRAPFVGVGWVGFESDGDAGRLLRGGSKFTVFLVTKNAAGVTARYFGDDLGPGLLDMSTAAMAALHGWTIPSHGTVFATGAGNLYAEGWDTDDGAIAGIDISVMHPIGIAESLINATPDDLLRLGATWHFGGDPVDDTYTVRAA